MSFVFHSKTLETLFSFIRQLSPFLPDRLTYPFSSLSFPWVTHIISQLCTPFLLCLFSLYPAIAFMALLHKCFILILLHHHNKSLPLATMQASRNVLPGTGWLFHVPQLEQDQSTELNSKQNVHVKSWTKPRQHCSRTGNSLQGDFVSLLQNHCGKKAIYSHAIYKKNLWNSSWEVSLMKVHPHKNESGPQENTDKSILFRTDSIYSHICSHKISGNTQRVQS